MARDPAALRAVGIQPASAYGYVSQLWAMTTWSSWRWLPRIDAPALVIAGDEDPIVPLVNARVLARRLPRAELHVVRGGGHLALLDSIEQVAPVVRRFLAAALDISSAAVG